MKQDFTVRQGALDGVEVFLSVAQHRISAERPRNSGKLRVSPQNKGCLDTPTNLYLRIANSALNVRSGSRPAKGCLYVCIRKSDLAQRRFDRCWTLLQCT